MIAWLARSALMTSPAGAFLKAVPRWAWIALGAVALLVAGVVWHHGKVRAHDKAVIAAEDARLAKQALELKARIDALNSQISSLIKDKNDAENRRIAADADALRVSGPGKAVCRSAGLPAPASGYVAPGRPGAATVDSVPDTEGQQLIGLPFAPAIDFAEQCDINRSEALSWREWYQKLAASWPKSAK